MTFADHALTMALYHRWAYERLYEQLAALDDARYHADCGLFFKSVHGTLDHLLLVDRLWRGRMCGKPHAVTSLDEPQEPDRARLEAAILAECDEWIDFVRSVPEQRYAMDLTFHRVNGEAMTMPFAELLMHVFNHGTHHRGQVTAAMTGFGLAAPVMDLAYFLPHRAARLAALD